MFKRIAYTRLLPLCFLLFFTSISIACNAIGKNSPQKKFWRSVQNILPDGDSAWGKPDLFQRISTELNKVDSTLSLGQVMTFNNEGQSLSIYISAWGVREKFPVIEKLVKAAPKIPHLKIYALSKPNPLPDKFEFGASEIKTSDIYFTAVKKDTWIEASFYFPHVDKWEKLPLHMQFSGFIYEFVGEKRFGNMTNVTIHNIASKPDNETVLPLKDLPVAVDALLGSKKRKP